MKNKKSLFIIILLILTFLENFSSRLFSQSLPPIHFTHYTTDDGLPHDIGYQIYQDNKGFLWIGTDNGLARFDGFEFKIYGDQAGLTNPFPIDMVMPNEEDLYICTWGNGLYKKTKDTIVHVPLGKNAHKISRVNFKDPNFLRLWGKTSIDTEQYSSHEYYRYDLLENKLRMVLFFETNGNYYQVVRSERKEDNLLFPSPKNIYENLNGELIRIITPNILSQDNHEIYLTSKGALKIDTTSQFKKLNLWKINHPTFYEAFKPFLTETNFLKPLTPFNEQLEGIIITCMIEDQKGGFWLGSKGKIYHLTKDGKLTTYPCLTSEATPFELSIWQNKFLVFFNYEDRSKLFLMEMTNGHIHDLKEDLQFSTTISDIFLDKEENLWVTTDGSGLYSLKPFITQNYSKEEGLENNFIYEIIESDKGPLFAATKDGLFYFKNGRWIKIDDPIVNIEQRKGLEIGKNGNLLLSGDEFARNLIELKIPSLEFTKLNYNSIGRNFVIDRKDRIWSLAVFSNTQSCYRNNLQEKLKVINKQGGWGKGFSKSLIDSLYAKQEIWHDQFTALEINDKMIFGTSRGLFEFSGTSSFEYYSKESGLPSRIVNDIALSKDGKIWVATEEGICIKEGDQFSPIPTNGLISKQIRKLLFDHKDQLWVGTPDGLHYYIPAEETWIPITKNMGLVANDITSLFEDKQNQLWVGTSRGISMLPNADPQKRGTPPAISIERILLNNKIYKLQTTGKKIPFRSSVKFDYNAITFQSAKDLAFQYRLNTSEVWQTTNNRSVVFSDLADGKYHFQIRTKKPNSTWSKTDNFIFTVQPPWFRSIWALLIAGIIAFLIGRFLFLRRIRLERNKIEAKAQIKEELAQLEMKALQAQMNPHFIFNAMNSIMDFVMNEDKYEANQYLAKFAKLMRLFLDASKSNYISIAEELEMIQIYVELEKLRFKNKFDFNISYNKELPIEVLEIPSMLIQPFIENAIHHGLHLKEEKGQLEMRIALVEDQLKIQIEDNGIGRAAASAAKKQSLKSYKSRGSQIVQEKINLLNTRQDDHYSVTTIDLKDHTGRPTGTRVCIDISIQD